MPLTTLVPIKQILLTSRTLSLSISAGLISSVVFCDTAPKVSYFSTGIDSPVNTAWLTNRSLDSIKRISAGIISPADNNTISPGTISLRGTSICSAGIFLFGRRRTVAVVRIIDLSASAALFERNSCQKRSKPLNVTMVKMIIMPVRSVSSPLCSGNQ